LQQQAQIPRDLRGREPLMNQQVQLMDNLRKTGGTLSLKIKLPKRGQKHTFNTFYVPENQQIKGRFFACHRFIYYLGYALALGIFLAAGVAILWVRKQAAGIILLCTAGAWVLFYLLPFSWQQIFVFMALGIGLYFGGRKVKNKYTS
jgi:hypothetical protein